MPAHTQKTKGRRDAPQAYAVDAEDVGRGHLLDSAPPMIDPSSLSDTDRGRWLEHTSEYARGCVGQLLDWSEDYLYVSFDDNLTAATMVRPEQWVVLSS